MNAPEASPTVAIIVEWENAILQNDEVALAMLGRLAEESRSLANVKEVRFVFDPEIVDSQTLQALVKTKLGAVQNSNSLPDLKFQPVERAHYYEFKNQGAREASTDIVAFLDSDVLPDPGWIKALTAPLLADPNCVAAAGTTHIKPGSSVDAAFAAGWFFPLPADVKPRRNVKYFFANNVAFRRSYFVEHPFPDMPEGVTRGACSSLARQMARENHKISYQPAARAWHPPPNGLDHFVKRALAQGRDDACNEPAETVLGKLGRMSFALGRLVVVPVRTAWRIALNRRHLKAGLLTPVYGAGIMLAYSTLQFAGLLIAYTAPAVARNNWKI